MPNAKTKRCAPPTRLASWAGNIIWQTIIGLLLRASEPCVGRPQEASPSHQHVENHADCEHPKQCPKAWHGVKTQRKGPQREPAAQDEAEVQGASGFHGHREVACQTGGALLE